MNRLQLDEIEELHHFLNEVLNDPKTKTRRSDKKFRITDKATAEWALRKINALNAQIKENEEIYKAELDRIERWLRRETKAAKDSIEYFEALLEEWIREEFKKDKHIRSIRLPHGTIRLKKQQPDFIRNEEKLIQWAKENERMDLIKIQESFDWASFKKEIQVIGNQVVDRETGEVIEGVYVDEKNLKFEVEGV